jgi:gamma-glutamylcyclotransferase (GGCT)/AIG2-like uncharacterized protein YtfP
VIERAATDLLAVYGTLRRGFRNHPLTLGRADWVGEGSLPGRLLHIGGPVRAYPYPGYVPGPDGTVVVEVLHVTDPTLWPDLHRLERYVPHDRDACEYVLVEATATMADGRTLACATYAYHRDDGTWPTVPGGDWARAAG